MPASAQTTTTAALDIASLPAPAAPAPVAHVFSHGLTTRSTAHSLACVALTAAMLLTSAGLAAAQQTADQIISALKPSGDLVGGSTRGIRLGGGAAAPASTAAKPVATSAQPRHPSTAGNQAIPAAARHALPEPAAANLSVNVTVNFPTGSADLTPTARASLDSLGRALASQDLATYRFRIEGHTDNVGTAPENLTLSQRRAEAVVTYLSGQYRVQPARLEAIGIGQDRPLIQAPAQTPEARNRRVQVINLGG